LIHQPKEVKNIDTIKLYQIIEVGERGGEKTGACTMSILLLFSIVQLHPLTGFVSLEKRAGQLPLFFSLRSKNFGRCHRTQNPKGLRSPKRHGGTTGLIFSSFGRKNF